jgi:hypothetical protein
LSLSAFEAVEIGRTDGEKFNMNIKDKLDTTSNGYLLQAERALVDQGVYEIPALE